MPDQSLSAQLLHFMKSITPDSGRTQFTKQFSMPHSLDRSHLGLRPSGNLPLQLGPGVALADTGTTRDHLRVHEEGPNVELTIRLTTVNGSRLAEHRRQSGWLTTSTRPCRVQATCGSRQADLPTRSDGQRGGFPRVPTSAPGSCHRTRLNESGFAFR